MNLLEGAKIILKTLHEQGYEAYIVGGYVRDYLLGVKSTDIDIATNAHPEVVATMFPKTILTGMKHGTVTVVIDKKQYEVTTFRTDGNYLDRRRPDQVTFVGDLQTDIKRRDFTINALSLTIDEQVIDFVGGIEDIKKRIIRTVGNPYERFSEDALRMLRVFRFVSQLGFTVDEETLEAIKVNRELMNFISKERIIMEIAKLVLGKYFHDAIKLIFKTEFYKAVDFLNHGLDLLVNLNFTPTDFSEFLTFLAVTGNYEAIMNLPLANVIKKTVTDVYEMYSLEINEFTNPILFRQGLYVCLLTNKLNHYLRKLPDKQEEIKNQYENLPIKRVCDLAYKGSDLIIRYPERKGPWIGDMIDEICLKILLGELKNDYHEIEKYVEEKVKSE